MDGLCDLGEGRLLCNPSSFFLQRGAILLSGNAPTIKITLWGLSTLPNAPFLGAIYPKKRCTFANVVGSYAINVPPTCLQSRPTHPVKSAFYTILLRFSWDIGIYFLTTPLTAERKSQGFLFVLWGDENQRVRNRRSR